MRLTSPLILCVLFALDPNNTAFGTENISAANDTIKLATTERTTKPMDSSATTLQEWIHTIPKVDHAAQAASNSTELIEAWQIAQQTATSIGQILRNSALTSSVTVEPEITLINQQTTWGQVGVYGEGYHIAFELSLAYWSSLANKLPDPQAKTFFALAALAYDNASFRGWSNIQQRTWDYGGCSPFGTGLHLNILTTIDVIQRAPAFASKVTDTLQRVRELVLHDVLKGTEEFPYCKRNEPEQVTKMLQEGQSIMTNIVLSTDERTGLKERLDTKLGLSGT